MTLAVYEMEPIGANGTLEAVACHHFDTAACRRRWIDARTDLCLQAGSDNEVQDGEVCEECGNPLESPAPAVNSSDATRAARIAKLIEGTQAAEDGQLEEFQTEPAQFLVVEYGCGDPLWAMAAITLDDAAKQIDESETQRDSVTVYDLDSTDEWTPVFETVKFFRSKGADGEHRVTPAR